MMRQAVGRMQQLAPDALLGPGLIPESAKFLPLHRDLPHLPLSGLATDVPTDMPPCEQA